MNTMSMNTRNNIIIMTMAQLKCASFDPCDNLVLEQHVIKVLIKYLSESRFWG